MPKIEINKERCKGCELCLLYCSKGLIKLGKEINRKGVRAAVFSGEDKCTGCCFCAIMCPDLCITVYK